VDNSSHRKIIPTRSSTGKTKDGVRFMVRVRIRSRVKIRVRIRAMVEVRVRVRVSVSYIMTIWRWEEFSRCDKFSTTPDPPKQLLQLQESSAGNGRPTRTLSHHVETPRVAYPVG